MRLNDNPPDCPVSGNAAVRHVLSVPARALAELWRNTFAIDVTSCLGAHERIDLWESETGLHFFDPLVEGDRDFYTELYTRRFALALWDWNAMWREFDLAAKRIRPGDRVLDVGCGFGTFRAFIPQARYVGLDPNFAFESDLADIRPERLSQHVVRNAGVYDAVCAFQVLEHLSTPYATFADMVQATRPGGTIIVGVPRVPASTTAIPDFLMNGPPHHLTWWTEAALKALAKRCDVRIDSIENISAGYCDRSMQYVERYSPIRCSRLYFRHPSIWRRANAALVSLAKIGEASGSARANRQPVGLFMVAQRL
jgi:SAM-dependent methyltransferase